MKREFASRNLVGRKASSLLLAGIVTASSLSSTYEKGRPGIENVIPPAPTPAVLPQEETQIRREERTDCRPLTIVVADGLGATEKGLSDLRFFDPIAQFADKNGIDYTSIQPENLHNPNRKQWERVIIDKIKEIKKAGGKVALLGYSHGGVVNTHVLAASVDPENELYDPELASTIELVIEVASRDLDEKNRANHQELSNYPDYYENRPTDRLIAEIRKKYAHKIHVYAQEHDQTVPVSQSKHLAEQLGASFTLADVTRSDGSWDTHFGTSNSGDFIAQGFQTVLSAGCETIIVP